MAENSKIEWTDHTFNPWEGCQKVGPGCDNCYAEARQDKRHAARAAQKAELLRLCARCEAKETTC